ncbi:MAG: NAD(P)H-hydrate dehydratase [Bacteroidales bacterium]|nr:NAD(P)H-hydrate dehydratase [Bacteroidales bacterium]
MKTIDPAFLLPRLKTRPDDSHKGDYGHLLLVCGCHTMPGAAVLATGAALKSGCGLVTLHSTANALLSTAVNFPSAMLSEDPDGCFSLVPEGLERYDAIAVGPGLGKNPQTAGALAKLLSGADRLGIPTVLDADALNLLAARPALLDRIPAGSIMTPHPGELRRLADWESPEQKEEAARALARRSACVLVSKGFHTEIFTPEGERYVNATGNPGLAKGGSGDVLTGLIGGLLARGYDALTAATLGVWIHGFAGDVLTERCTAEAYSSRDLIDALYLGFKALEERR